MKTFVYVSLAFFAILAISFFFIFEYGASVPLSGVHHLEVKTSSNGSEEVVNVDGTLVGSAVAISSIKQHRSGDGVVIVIRQVPVRAGNDKARFHVEVVIPNDVKRISIGDVEDTIWTR